jgi:hypothetical protein
VATPAQHDLITIADKIDEVAVNIMTMGRQMEALWQRVVNLELSVVQLREVQTAAQNSHCALAGSVQTMGQQLLQINVAASRSASNTSAWTAPNDGETTGPAASSSGGPWTSNTSAWTAPNDGETPGPAANSSGGTWTWRDRA